MNSHSSILHEESFLINDRYHGIVIIHPLQMCVFKLGTPQPPGIGIHYQLGMLSFPKLRKHM